MKSISKNILKRFFFYGFLLIVILIVCTPFMVNGVANTQIVKKKLSSLIHEKTGTSIDPSKFSAVIFPQPKLKISDFSTSLTDQLTLEIDHLEFVINLQQLLSKKLVLDHIMVEHPHLHSTQDKTETTNPSFPSIALNDQIKEVNKIFSVLPPHQQSIEVIFKNLASPYFNRMDGTLYVSKLKKELLLNYKIHDFVLTSEDLKAFNLEKHFPAKQLNIGTISSILKLDTYGKIQGQSIVDSFQITGKDAQTFFDSDRFECKFLLSDHAQQIEILPFDIKTPKGHLGIHFKNNFKKKLSSLEFTGTNIHVDQAREKTMALVKNSEVVSTLFWVLRKGIARSIQVSFQSQSIDTLIDEDRLNLSGHVENGMVKIPNANLIISDITGDVTIQKGVLTVNASSGLVQNSKIQKGNLVLDLMNYPDYPFKGTFQLDVDLSKIPKTLISLLPESTLTRELALIDTIEGQAQAQLDLTFLTGAEYPDVVVQTTDFSALGKYSRIPGNIQIDHLNFGFDSDIVTLKNLYGSLQNSQLNNVHAKINLTDTVKSPWVDIQSGSGTIDLSTIVPWVLKYDKPRQILSPLKTAKGKLNFSNISISGPVLLPEEWMYSAAGNGENISAGFIINQENIRNGSGEYDFSNNHFALNHLNMVLPQIPDMGSFKHSSEVKSIRVPLKIHQAKISSKPDFALLSGTLDFKDGPELKLDMQGTTLETLLPTKIQIKDQSFSNAVITPIHSKIQPMFNFEGTLDIVSVINMLKPDSFLDQKLERYTQGQSFLIQSNKKNELNIDTDRIDLNPFLMSPKPQETESQKVESKETKPFKLDQFYTPNHIVNLNTARLNLKKFEFKDIQSRISLEKDHSYIRLKSGMLCNIKTNGYINFKNKLIFASFPFEAKDKPNIQDLFSCLLDKEQFMDGNYSLHGDLRSSAVKDKFTEQLNGGFEFNAKDGRIYKLTLLSRILSVLNVSNLFRGKIPNILQDGFAYSKVLVEADIKDSKIYLKKAVIDGTDMTMIFTGWIDPLNDQLELTCLVAPFKTIDLIVKYIPIINTMFSGRLITIPVKASGKLSDPNVIPLHPSAVGKGLVDVMSGILKTPVKLWDKLYNE